MENQEVCIKHTKKETVTHVLLEVTSYLITEFDICGMLAFRHY